MELPGQSAMETGHPMAAKIQHSDSSVRSSVEASSQPEIAFSLVVCSKDRVTDLTLTLGSALEALEAAAYTWEVLVIDNASSDSTEREAGKVLGNRGRVVREENLGLSNARNRALREARGEVIVYIDDDITISESWVRTIESAFEREGVTAVGGPVQTIFPAGSDQGYIKAVMADGGSGTGDFQPGGQSRRVDHSNGFPRGGNMAIRKSAALGIDGFNHELGWGKGHIPGEETDLFRRILEFGGDIWFESGASVRHRLQPEKVNWEYLRRWHRGYGRASVIMRGQLGLVGTIIKIAEQCAQWACYSPIACARGKRGTARPWRKKWQAEGRLAQLLRLG